MNKYRYKANDIYELSNQLSLNDMCKLINCFSDNIDAYIGIAGNHQITSELEFSCTNGHLIQLNLESSNFKNLKDWRFLMEGLSHSESKTVKKVKE